MLDFFLISIYWISYPEKVLSLIFIIIQDFLGFDWNRSSLCYGTHLVQFCREQFCMKHSILFSLFDTLPQAAFQGMAHFMFRPQLMCRAFFFKKFIKK